MIYVEIELDGVVTAKRCPRQTDEHGLISFQAIRDYFSNLGYRVGTIRVC